MMTGFGRGRSPRSVRPAPCWDPTDLRVYRAIVARSGCASRLQSATESWRRRLPGGCEATRRWSRSAICLAGCPGDVGGDDITGMPVPGLTWRIVVRGSACDAGSCTSPHTPQPATRTQTRTPDRLERDDESLRIGMQTLFQELRITPVTAAAWTTLCRPEECKLLAQAGSRGCQCRSPGGAERRGAIKDVQDPQPMRRDVQHHRVAGGGAPHPPGPARRVQ